MSSRSAFIWLMGLLMGVFPHYSLSAVELAAEPALTPTLQIAARETVPNAVKSPPESTEEAALTNGGLVEKEASGRLGLAQVEEASQNEELPSAMLTAMQTLPSFWGDELLGGLDGEERLEDGFSGVEGMAK